MPCKGEKQMNQNKLIRLSAAVVVLSIAAAVLLPSDSKISSTHDYLAKRSLSQDVENALLHMRSMANFSIAFTPP